MYHGGTVYISYNVITTYIPMYLWPSGLAYIYQVKPLHNYTPVGAYMYV